MTENAQFAMPEVGIGFFPDVGGSHLLPDLGGSFGMYLALTGNRIRYGDALWSGLATHTIKAADQSAFLDRLCADGDPESVLRGFFVPAKRETGQAGAGGDRPPFRATLAGRHRRQPGAGGRRRRIRRQDAGDDPHPLADQPAMSPGARSAPG